MSRTSDTAKAASKELSELIKELGTDLELGLISTEAKLRLEKFGENTLSEEEETFWAALKEEAREPMILLLIGIGVLYSI